MQFIHADLGQRRRGDVVEVILHGSAANVVLLDSSNFTAFKAGRRHRYHGGLARRSPVHLSVPSSGHWYGVVYLPAGYRGRVSATFRVLPGALPPLGSQASPDLGSIHQALSDFHSHEGSLGKAEDAYDVFISHASEDKESFVRPLAESLREEGVKVWYDDFELKIGDSLRQKIDKGLANSRFGVVVLSPAFFSKGWPNYELDGLVTRQITGGRQVILPIWHNVQREVVAKFSPSLADKVARDTSRVQPRDLAREIAQVVKESREE